jgi:hypothetical protein
VSEQSAEQTSDEPGSIGPLPAAPDSPAAQSEPAPASAQQSMQGSIQDSTHQPIESPDLVPEPTAAGAPPKLDAPKADAAGADVPETAARRAAGNVMIMSSGERAWDGTLDDDGTGPEAQSAQNSPVFGKRRFAALAAVVALAAVAGAIGGALATAGLGYAGLGYSVGDGTALADNRALEASVGRIDADIQALKGSVEHVSRLETTQFNKTSDRLDKVEKAQAEPAAKLAKLSEAVDKLRTMPVAAAPVAAVPVAAKEATGSISPPAAAPATPPKVEPGRLPTLEGWVLRDVANGGALIEGRQGMFEVYAGDPVPGLGRVDAIRRQDGRWVVVTSRGLIVAR